MALTPAEIEQLQERLDAYYEAERAVLRNQSYKMPDGRELTRASLASIQKAIDSLRNEIANASGAPIVRGRIRRGVMVGR